MLEGLRGAECRRGVVIKLVTIGEIIGFDSDCESEGAASVKQWSVGRT